MTIELRKSPTGGRIGDARTPFGRLLRSLREDAGLSQSALADRARLDHSAVSRWESGMRENPTRDSVELLAQAMDLDQWETEGLMVGAGYVPRIPEIRSLALLLADPRLRDLERDLLLSQVRALTETGSRFLEKNGSGE